MITIRSILVASDLTDGSDEVVRAGAALAALTGAELHLLHSFDLERSPYDPREGTLPNFEGRVRAAEEALEDQARRLVPQAVKMRTCDVVIYAAHRAILECAKGHDADLIVLGAHRGSSAIAGFLGTTTDRVVRTAAVPCLIVRGPLSLPVRRLLVPFDLSSPARRALDVAIAWAAAFHPGGAAKNHSELVLLHVLPSAFEAEGFPFDRSVVVPELKREAEDALTRAGGGEGVELRAALRWSDTTAAEIAAVAEEERVDLLVMATHGRNALQRALLGSVASGVSRYVRCPLLLVPPSLWQG